MFRADTKKGQIIRHAYRPQALYVLAEYISGTAYLAKVQNKVGYPLAQSRTMYKVKDFENMMVVDFAEQYKNFEWRK
jgi:hypothetical protein